MSKMTLLVGNKLHVTDIDRLVEIDIAAGKIANVCPAAGARFLNDLAVATDEEAGLHVIPQMQESEVVGHALSPAEAKAN